jgi:hypothetical protein
MEQNLCPITFLSRKEIEENKSIVYEVDKVRNIFYDVIALGTWIKKSKMRHPQDPPTFPHSREPMTQEHIDEIQTQIDKSEQNILFLSRPKGPPKFNGHLCVVYMSADGVFQVKCYGNGTIVSKPNGYQVVGHLSEAEDQNHQKYQNLPFNPWLHDAIILKRVPTFGEYCTSFSRQV